MRVRECAAPSLVDNPQRAYEYWKANIPQSGWYDEAKEAFVVLVLNTRSRIIGHNLVTLGLVDQCLVHAREVFRPAICAAGKEIILIHSHPSGDVAPSDPDIRGDEGFGSSRSTAWNQCQGSYRCRQRGTGLQGLHVIEGMRIL